MEGGTGCSGGLGYQKDKALLMLDNSLRIALTDMMSTRRWILLEGMKTIKILVAVFYSPSCVRCVLMWSFMGLCRKIPNLGAKRNQEDEGDDGASETLRGRAKPGAGDGHGR